MANQEEVSGTLIERWIAWSSGVKNFRDRLLKGLGLVALLFLVSSLYLLRHDEPSEHMVPHVFSVFLELALGLFFIEMIWKGHEKREEEKQKRDQLRFLKSHMFQGQMQELFVANFYAMKSPSISFQRIWEDSKRGGFTQLKINADEKNISYGSEGAEQAVLLVFLEYLKAKSVWERFTELAIMFGFGKIVGEMNDILQCILEVEELRGHDKGGHVDQVSLLLKIHEIDKTRAPDDKLMARLEKITKQGILKFIEYAEDLSQHEPRMFDQLIQSYIRAMQRYISVKGRQESL
jgi:hypothetical protein